MCKVPPEIQLLILQELDGQKDVLRECALVCKLWHELCLPALFRELVIDIEDLQAHSDFLVNSPHIRTHIRKLKFEFSPFPVHVHPREDHMIVSLLLGLPRLDELLCTSIIFTTLSTVLPQLSITKLYLQEDIYAPRAFLPVLRAVAGTLRSLTLEEFVFVDEDDLAIEISVGPIIMTALEELAIVHCNNLPLTSNVIRMPSLKILYYGAGWAAMGDDNFEPLNVDNLCVLWWEGDRHHLLGAVKQAANEFAIPSQIRHIEILPSVLCGERVKLDQLEAYALDLRRSGRLEQLTITVGKDDILGFGSVVDRLPTLSDLGLLDIRTGRPSVLYPGCDENNIQPEWTLF
ncbi:hypothetical protein PC9H_001309 [Pleurotus ostreatus]|uniref:F-box domain-containing protein n=1 Tax=Pleurotus ostreatus TaxID=5322 RepID=A0A8H7DXN3_PLEOS|nr:uncharacterized protein PC9H_001309 [Pleurotus ostreatus]KAF7440960.1 hypothetical protein PC9H_001309 [Pleurotus ostreatus]